MNHYAQFDIKTAPLYTDFGYKMAIKWFGEEQVAKLPKFVKGKHAGKPKGLYVWKKCTRGGWVSVSRETANSDAEGYVEKRVGWTIERQLCTMEWVGNGYGVKDTLFTTHNQPYQVQKQQQLGYRMDALRELYDNLIKNIEGYKENLVAMDNLIADDPNHPHAPKVRDVVIEKIAELNEELDRVNASMATVKNELKQVA